MRRRVGSEGDITDWIAWYNGLTAQYGPASPGIVRGSWNKGEKRIDKVENSATLIRQSQGDQREAHRDEGLEPRCQHAHRL